MEKGQIVGSFELVKQIKSIDELYKVLTSEPSVFWRFKVTSSAFFLSWQIRTLARSIELGLFWTVKRINK